MLKRNASKINVLSRLFDVVIMLTAWYVAYFWRFGEKYEFESEFFIRYCKQSLVLATLTYFVFRRLGAYSSARFNTILQDVMLTTRMVAVVFILQVMLVYFGGTEKLSRLFLMGFLGCSLVLMIFSRLSVRFFLRSIRSHGKNLRYAVLVGDGPQMIDLSQTLKENPGFGVQLVAWFEKPEGINSELKNAGPFNMDEVKRLNPDLLIVGYSVTEFPRASHIFEAMKNELIGLVMVPDTSHSLIGFQMLDLGGIPAIALNHASFSTSGLVFKRVFDFTASAIGLILISPLLLIISILVKLSSKGPIFYSQQRMGLDGKTFKMWKFRSMKVAADGGGTGWTVENDPRRTKIGTFLRKTSLDELPQLWNVLVGDMSLVGPRPEQPYYVEKFRKEVPSYMLRHHMKAGITGWAQINGWRGNTSIPRRIECDIYYIKNWSPWLDIKILVLTFVKGFINRNAY